MDRGFAGLLEKNGLDPIRDEVRMAAKEFGKPLELNLDWVRERAIGTKKPEAWESEFVGRRKWRHEPLAGSMHQPMEWRIARAIARCL
jgi:hypothetical protein